MEDAWSLLYQKKTKVIVPEHGSESPNDLMSNNEFYLYVSDGKQIIKK